MGSKHRQKLKLTQEVNIKKLKQTQVEIKAGAETKQNTARNYNKHKKKLMQTKSK